MRVAHKRFASLGGPFHRAIYLFRCPGDDYFFRVVKDLGSESATDVRRDHSELVLGYAHHERAHQQTNHVRVLARRIKRVFILAAVIFANGRTRLHRIRDQAIVDNIDANDFFGTVECRVGRFLIADFPVETYVPFRIVPYPRCALGARGLEIGNRR